MGNTGASQKVTIHYTTTLMSPSGVLYTTTKNTSPHAISPQYATNKVGINYTYKDTYTFTSPGKTPITTDITVKFNMNYVNYNITLLRVDPVDKTNVITYTITTLDAVDHSGNVHTQTAQGMTTGTYPPSFAGCPCPPQGSNNVGQNVITGQNVTPATLKAVQAQP